MVECPSCGLFISGLEPKCDICVYQPNWEDYYDYDLIDTNSIDKILEYASYDVLDIVRERKKIKPNFSANVCFCPECNSFIIQNNIFIYCENCGYQGILIMNSESLWQQIIEVILDAPLDFIEKHKLDNFWFVHGYEHYHCKGYTVNALLCYDKAIELNELNGDAWCQKAAIYDDFGDYSQRDECYKQMLKSYNHQLKINPKDDYTWNKKGEYYLKKNNLKRALKCFNKAIKLDSNIYEYWNNKGDYYKCVNDYDSALKCYDRALSINKTLKKTLLSKAEIFKELKMYSLMLECYDTIIEFDDYPYLIWEKKFDHYCMTENYKKAKYCLDKAIESDTYNLYPEEYLMDEGNMHYQMGEYSKALLCYEKVISINKSNDDAWFQKALVYDKLEEYELMLKCYREVLLIYPGNDAAWFNIGIYHMNNGRYMKAIKYFNKSLEFRPDDEEAWINKGDCYLMRDYYYAAKCCYKEALKINPNNKYAKDMVKELKY